jgi:undecaprenyl-diphosphatase
MDLISSLILSIVQGVLEWFPVSSSGHLTLVEKILVLDEGLALQVALHFGTLMAVFVYFRKDIIYIIRDILNRKWTEYSKLGLLLIIASIPAGIVGFLLSNLLDGLGANLLVLGFGWMTTSVILFIGSFSSKKSRKIGYLQSLFIGLAQMFAIIPGVSRSGMTISSGLFFGMNEKDSIRFSYLLSIPIILGANIFTFGNKTLPIEYIIPSLVCFFLGLIFMNLSFKYILSNRKNLIWFGIYAFILGLTCIIIAL